MRKLQKIYWPIDQCLFKAFNYPGINNKYNLFSFYWKKN